MSHLNVDSGDALEKSRVLPDFRMIEDFNGGLGVVDVGEPADLLLDDHLGNVALGGQLFCEPVGDQVDASRQCVPHIRQLTGMGIDVHPLTMGLPPRTSPPSKLDLELRLGL